jgi:aspartate/methionine/tyrosine aminotransferase
VLLVNAPNNPTGWTLTRAEQQACWTTAAHRHLDRGRRGLRAGLYYGEAPAAPSASWTCPADDRLVVVHSFSKSFLMTGWRLGWLVLPPGTWTRPAS